MISLVRLLVAFADDFRPVSQVTEGNIAVLSGLKETSTGDTLVASQREAREAHKSWKAASAAEDDATCPFLSGLSVPSPVFRCSVEPPSMMEQKQLELALKNLSKVGNGSGSGRGYKR